MVLLDTETPGTSREIYSEDADICIYKDADIYIYIYEDADINIY